MQTTKEVADLAKYYSRSMHLGYQRVTKDLLRLHAGEKTPQLEQLESLWMMQSLRHLDTITDSLGRLAALDPTALAQLPNAGTSSTATFELTNVERSSIRAESKRLRKAAEHRLFAVFSCAAFNTLAPPHTMPARSSHAECESAVLQSGQPVLGPSGAPAITVRTQPPQPDDRSEAAVSTSRHAESAADRLNRWATQEGPRAAPSSSWVGTREQKQARCSPVQRTTHSVAEALPPQVRGSVGSLSNAPPMSPHGTPQRRKSLARSSLVRSPQATAEDRANRYSYLLQEDSGATEPDGMARASGEAVESRSHGLCARLHSIQQELASVRFPNLQGSFCALPRD